MCMCRFIFIYVYTNVVTNIYTSSIRSKRVKLTLELWTMRRWHCFKCRNYFLSTTKGFLFKLRSCLKNKAKEHKNGMVSLYKDMEACGGYEDIQVMWEMIHSSSSNAKKIKRNM